MPQPDNPLSNVDNVRIGQFLGLDANRNRTANEDYAVGVRAVNLGRKERQPLAPRLGLRPVTSSNGNHVFGGQAFAFGALASGGRLSLIMRLSGGRLVAANDITLVEDGE